MLLWLTILKAANKKNRSPPRQVWIWIWIHYKLQLVFKKNLKLVNTYNYRLTDSHLEFWIRVASRSGSTGSVAALTKIDTLFWCAGLTLCCSDRPPRSCRTVDCAANSSRRRLHSDQCTDCRKFLQQKMYHKVQFDFTTKTKNTF